MVNALSAAWEFLFQSKEAPKPPNLHREAGLGAGASALLESTAYQDAMRKVREGIHIKWADSPVADKDGQHELRLMLKLLNDLDGNIKQVALTGQMAVQQIEQEKRK